MVGLVPTVDFDPLVSTWREEGRLQLMSFLTLGWELFWNQAQLQYHNLPYKYLMKTKEDLNGNDIVIAHNTCLGKSERSGTRTMCIQKWIQVTLYSHSVVTIYVFMRLTIQSWVRICANDDNVLQIDTAGRERSVIDLLRKEFILKRGGLSEQMPRDLDYKYLVHSSVQTLRDVGNKSDLKIME